MIEFMVSQRLQIIEKDKNGFDIVVDLVFVSNYVQ